MKKTIKIVAFIIILIVLMKIISEIYSPIKTAEGGWEQKEPIREFYMQDRNQIDTIYLGASSVYCGISPLEIYSTAGITGYALSSSEQTVWTSYYLLKEVFEYQKPKVVFLETEEFFTTKETQKDIDNRMDMDEIQDSLNKLTMINDPIYNLSSYDKLTAIFNLLYYHNRWNQLNESDIYKAFNKEQIHYKGYIYDNTIKKLKDIEQKRRNPDICNVNKTLSKETIEKLKEIKKLCDDNECKLVFISMPLKVSYHRDRNEKIAEYAKENNVKFIDFNSDENKIQLNWNKDSLDDNGNHLNIYGAQVIGKYLANYLKTNYNLEDHRQDQKYESWNQMLSEYNQRKQKDGIQ